MIHIRNWWIIPTSLVIALVLTRLPLPTQIAIFLPSWISLIIIYWASFLKAHFGVLVAFSIGIIADVFLGDLLGQNALIYSSLAFVARSQSKRLSTAPMVQQMLIILSYEMMRLLFVLVIRGLGQSTPLNINSYFFPAISSALAWPWIYYSLRQLQRRFDLR